MARVRTACAMLGLGAAAVAMPGCLITSSNSTSYSGEYVSPEEVRAVSLGETTPEMAETLLGPPTTRTQNDDGSELLSWSYTKSKSGQGTLLFVLSASDSRTEEQAVHILFRDGVAVKKWRS